MTAPYQQHRPAKSLPRSPMRDSSPYSPPEDIKDLASPQPSNSPFSVGTTPINIPESHTINTCFPLPGVQSADRNDCEDEQYLPPEDITTINYFRLDSQVEDPKTPMGLPESGTSYSSPKENLRILKYALQCIANCINPSIHLDPHSWATFLPSLDLPHENLTEVLVNIAQLIALNTDFSTGGRGMDTGFPVKTVAWETIASGDCVERMSSMMLTSGILQGVQRLSELKPSEAETEGAEGTEGVRYKSAAGE